MTATSTPADLADRLATYAARLRTAGAIQTDVVERAFAAVHRHECLRRFRYRADEYELDGTPAPPDEVLNLIYADNSLLTHSGHDGDPPSSSSAPSLMAKMLEALELRPWHRTLENRITRAYPDNTAFDPSRGVCALVEPGAGAAWIHRDGSKHRRR